MNEPSQEENALSFPTGFLILHLGLLSDLEPSRSVPDAGDTQAFSELQVNASQSQRGSGTCSRRVLRGVSRKRSTVLLWVVLRFVKGKLTFYFSLLLTFLFFLGLPLLSLKKKGGD